MRRSPHDPTRLSTYLRVHENRLAQLRGFFIETDTLQIRRVSAGLCIEGQIACRGGIVVTVFQVLEILDSQGDPRVRTIRYSYNASVRGHGSFLRYDNAHPHDGHSDSHHRHDFDWRTNRPVVPPQWVGEHGWPTLGTFLEYVETWYWENHADIPDPDGFPPIE